MSGDRWPNRTWNYKPTELRVQENKGDAGRRILRHVQDA
jgi:hypothetical protein